MTTEKTSSPRRSGADWFGLVAFAVLVICSTVLVVRLISTKFLPTGQLSARLGPAAPPGENRRQDRLRHRGPGAGRRHALWRGGSWFRAARHY